VTRQNGKTRANQSFCLTFFAKVAACALILTWLNSACGKTWKILRINRESRHLKTFSYINRALLLLECLGSALVVREESPLLKSSSCSSSISTRSLCPTTFKICSALGANRRVFFNLIFILGLTLISYVMFQIKMENMPLRCDCASPFITTLDPKQFKRYLTNLLTLAETFKMPVLYETMDWAAATS
jgi:hypothetical protein